MKDFISKGEGKGRFLKSSFDGSFEEFKALLRAGKLPFDFNGINEAGVLQRGTTINKNSLLSETTENLLGDLPEDPTPDEALQRLYSISGQVKLGEKRGQLKHTKLLPIAGCYSINTSGGIDTQKVETDLDTAFVCGPYMGILCLKALYSGASYTGNIGWCNVETGEYFLRSLPIGLDRSRTFYVTPAKTPAGYFLYLNYYASDSSRLFLVVDLSLNVSSSVYKADGSATGCPVYDSNTYIAGYTVSNYIYSLEYYYNGVKKTYSTGVTDFCRTLGVSKEGILFYSAGITTQNLYFFDFATETKKLVNSYKAPSSWGDFSASYLDNTWTICRIFYDDTLKTSVLTVDSFVAPNGAFTANRYKRVFNAPNTRLVAALAYMNPVYGRYHIISGLFDTGRGFIVLDASDYSLLRTVLNIPNFQTYSPVDIPNKPASELSRLSSFWLEDGVYILASPSKSDNNGAYLTSLSLLNVIDGTKENIILSELGGVFTNYGTSKYLGVYDRAYKVTYSGASLDPSAGRLKVFDTLTKAIKSMEGVN